MPATSTRKQKPVRRQPQTAAHLSIAERVELGKRAREKAPRSSQAGFEAGPGRPDPIELLEEQAAARVPSSCRSATGGCWCRRSPSTAARP